MTIRSFLLVLASVVALIAEIVLIVAIKTDPNNLAANGGAKIVTSLIIANLIGALWIQAMWIYAEDRKEILKNKHHP